MKQQVILLLFLFCFFRKEVQGQNNRQALIDKLLTRLHQQQLFNGAIVVGENGKILFSKGYGYANFQDSVRFTPPTPGDGGSNAKTLTAASILLLAEEGKLDLEDPVQVYLPNYPYPNTSVRNMITHSAGGLADYNYFFGKLSDTAILTNSIFLDILQKNKPTLFYPPGTNYYYENVGFDLAAQIVETLSGKSYFQFLRERFFHPLKMDSSFVRPARLSDWRPGRMMGYRYKNDSLTLHDIEDREGFYGGSNIWFTAMDLYRWGESFYHQPIFSKPLIKKIHARVKIGNKPSPVRLGAWYSGKNRNAFYYWGNVAAFYSWVYYDKKQEFTIAFMTNTSMPQWLRPLLTSTLIDIVEGRSHRRIVEPESEPFDRNEHKEYTGTYRVQDIGQVKISQPGTRLILTVKEGMEFSMHAMDNKTFYIPGQDLWISFSKLENGKFQKMNWHTTVVQTSGRRIPEK